MPMMEAGHSADAASLDSFVRLMARALRQHKWLFVGCFLAVLIPGLAVLAVIPPAYKATATVAITGPAPGPVLPGMAPVTDAAQSEDWPLTVSSLMQSREVAAAAMQAVPPAAPLPGSRGLTCRLSFGLICHKPLSDKARLAAQIDAFQNNLTVAPELHAQVIDVTVSAADPQRAADLANAVVQSYQKIALAQESANTTRLAGWLNDQSNKLRRSWVDAQEQADAFSADNHLMISQDGMARGPLIEQQISTVAANLAAAQAQLDGAQGSSVAGLASSSTPLMVSASDTLMQLENERDQLSAEFGPNYPKIEALNREIATTKSAVSEQTRSAIGSAQGGVAAAKRQVRQLSAQLEALRAEAAREGPAESEYTALSTRADSLRTAYQAFQQQADEVMDRPALLQPPVTLVSPAEAPFSPASPNKVKFAIGVFFISFVAGTAALMIKDRASPGFGQAQDMRSTLQLPLLATLPKLGPAAGGIDSHVLDEPYSRTSEAVRGLAATLSLLAGEHPGARTVLITSAGALEGKSTLATWLATVGRQSGERVLLIDGDHRRGSLMQDAAAKEMPGLTDLLAHKASIKDVVQTDAKTGVEFISAGSAAAPSFGSLDIGRLRALMAGLKETYGLIVIDSPPLLAMVDALVLGTIADQTVFVCRWQHSSRQAIMGSLDRMRSFGVQVTGVVVSMVEQDATLDFNGGYSRREGALINQLYGS
jgi:capsular exopolysaccharide synthesis family protein